MKTFILALTLLVSGTAFAVCPINIICANEYVIDSANSTGRVVEVFNNGKATVKYDNWGLRTARTKDLSKAVRCLKGICMKDRVMVQDAVGTVMSIYTNEKSYIKYDKYGWQLVRVTQMSKVVSN